jgi:hypothetical protein
MRRFPAPAISNENVYFIESTKPNSNGYADSPRFPRTRGKSVVTAGSTKAVVSAGKSRMYVLYVDEELAIARLERARERFALHTKLDARAAIACGMMRERTSAHKEMKRI